MDYQPETGMQRRRSLVSILFLPLLAFIAGIAIMGWALTRSELAERWLGLTRAAPAVPAAAQPAITVVRDPVPAQAQPSGGQPSTDPEIVRRVNRMEERLAQLDFQSRAAVGNADRAESLLVAFAARRALDRGVGLGYLETLLRQRFAATQAPAVATVFTAAREPVTLQQLQTELQDLAPRLTGGDQDQGWWQAFKTEMAGLITVRREGTPSTQPAERLKRAQQSLAAGQVEVALVEIMRLPGRTAAQTWIDQARRYVAARQALDTIETAALMEPPPLPVRPATPKAQPSPAPAAPTVP